MKLPVVHQKNYVTALPEGHRFPMRKFQRVYELLTEDVEPNRLEFIVADPVSERTLLSVHEKRYVNRFIRGDLSATEMRRIGLPWSEGLVRRTLTAVGGTVRTAQLSLEHGIACNTAGGTHHAFSGEGAGFCILNDLAVTAQYLVDRSDVDRVLIVDADVHQGNGTAEIFADSNRVITYSIHCSENYPFSPAESDFDVNCSENMGNQAYLERFRTSLKDVLDRVSPDFILYDAGVDVHRQDQLGRLRLNTEGIRRRDRFVVSQSAVRSIPLAAVIGGGYDEDISGLARRHTLLHRAALEVIGSDSPAGEYLTK